MAYDDWSDLITVNYKGGYGGEFFAFLLYESFHGEIEYQKHFENDLRYSFKPLDPLETTPVFWFSRLSHDEDIRLLPIHSPQEAVDILKKIKKICYVEDREEYISNLRIYFSENYFPKHIKNNVTRMHNFIENKNSIFIQEVFPKSLNYNLTCKTDSEQFVFKILFFYKVLAQHMTYISNENKLIITRNKPTIETNVNAYYNMAFSFWESKETGIQIDVFDFFINQNYKKYDLNLNEKKLNAYRNDIISILNKFDIDPYVKYSNSDMRQIFLNYLKKNNAPT